MTIADFHEERYKFLSNFFPSTVTSTDYRDHNVYPTVEHAYQASKSIDPVVREKICAAPTPGMAKKAGRAAGLRPDWEDVKLRIMLDLLRDKFSGSLGAALLATEDEQLIEGNTWGDRFWGVYNGMGENHLGRLLMQVRDELREKTA